MKTALVIGATGYIGRHIVAALQNQHPEAKVFGLSRTPDAGARGWRSLAGDLLENDLKAPKLANLLQELQPDVIYLAVATDKTAPIKSQLDLYVDGTRRLLDIIVESRLESRVIVLGSAAEYGYGPLPMSELTPANPQGEYGVAKLAQTQLSLLYARRYNLPVLVARIFNAYGQSPKSYATASIASQIARYELEKKVAIPHIRTQNLNGWRDFIHVTDIADALVALGNKSPDSANWGEIYNIGSGESHSIRFVLDHLLSRAALKEYEIQPHGPQDEERSQGVITKIIQDSGWHPKVALEEGLARELDYWRSEAKLLAGKL